MQRVCLRTPHGRWEPGGRFARAAHMCRAVPCLLLRTAEHQEGIQVLHYQNGQKYEPHFDYFHDTVNSDPSHGGQRVVTMLMYL